MGTLPPTIFNSPAMSEPEPKSPRVWLITSAFSPLGYNVAHGALKAGDCVAAGCTREDIEIECRGDGVQGFTDDDDVTGNGTCTSGEGEEKEREQRQEKGKRSMAALKKLGGERCVIVELDMRNIALCQSAVAQTFHLFHRIDVILNCTSQTYVGAFEELSPSLILAQFEIAYFGPVNMMRSALPHFRRQRGGHIVNVTGLTGHMGTPGLSARCASDHSLEGFSDSLAYEVAPFNIKVSIVEPPLEVNVMSAPIHLAPPQSTYNAPNHPTATIRKIVSSTLPSSPANKFFQQPFTDSATLAETVFIILTIAGMDNPPGRIIVGNESIEQVKERLKLVSEELEEFLEASLGADIPQEKKNSGKAAGGNSGPENSSGSAPGRVAAQAVGVGMSFGQMGMYDAVGMAEPFL